MQVTAVVIGATLERVGICAIVEIWASLVSLNTALLNDLTLIEGQSACCVFLLDVLSPSLRGQSLEGRWQEYPKPQGLRAQRQQFLASSEYV